MANSKIPIREKWGKKIDFLFAVIGFAVGFGNVWRFPYLVYKNGGGAFFIPYFLCVIIGGIPIFFLEVIVGQYTGQGGINAWTICPLLQGIGWATTSIVCYVNVYYNIILTWAIYFLYSSFTSQLPWDSCNNYWNTENCKLEFESNSSYCVQNVTNTNVTLSDNISSFSASWTPEDNPNSVDPTVEFWEIRVLGLSDGISNLGKIRRELAVCLILAWIVVFVCISKGIKSSGKVVYFTVTAPYVFLIVLLIRGVTLDGATKGILYYIVPDFTKLKELEVWIDAGTQVFFSYAVSIGALTSLGSYNKFHHNSYRDCFILAATNGCTSILAGFVIFSVLGHMAHLHNVDIAEVAKSGPGLVFIAYPKAVSQMPVAPLWAILFFFMLILIGLDSQFVSVEGLVTALVDTFPTLRKGYRRVVFTAFCCLCHFLVGLILVTDGGMYVFQMFDYYPASRIVLLVSFLELIAVAYLYGVNRFYDNMTCMFGFEISPYIKICWVVLAPLYTAGLFIASIINYENLTFDRSSGTYHYPDWAIIIGWMMAASTVVCIPITAIYKIVQYKRQGKSLWKLIEPEDMKRGSQVDKEEKNTEQRSSLMKGLNDMDWTEKPIRARVFREQDATTKLM